MLRIIAKYNVIRVPSILWIGSECKCRYGEGGIKGYRGLLPGKYSRISVVVNIQIR